MTTPVKPIDATDESFAEAIKTGKPVLVDFWAEWCGPCKKVGPIVDEIAAEHPEYTVVKVNIEVAKETTADFGVRGVPTLVVLNRSGEQVAWHNGVRPKAVLLDSLSQV